MPDVTLTATNGEPFNLITDTGYPNTLVFFGYTHCPDVCPLVMSDLTSAYLQLPTDVARRRPRSSSSPPTRPATTSEVLRDYLDQLRPATSSGSPATSTRSRTAAEAMGVAIEGMERLPSGGYDVGHGAQVIGFHEQRGAVIWTEGTPVDDMVARHRPNSRVGDRGLAPARGRLLPR